MTEIKNFFSNNRLNKGYKEVSNENETDMSIIKKQYKHILPPIDMIEQYEEINPGTFKKLMDMAEKEQNHRHDLNEMLLKKYTSAMRMGRAFSAILLMIISMTTITLGIYQNVVLAGIFALLAFTSIIIVSYIYTKKIISKKIVNRKYHKNQSKKNN